MRAKEDKMWCPDCQLAESAAAKEAKDYLEMKKRKGATLGKAQRLVEALLAENEQQAKELTDIHLAYNYMQLRITELEGKNRQRADYKELVANYKDVAAKQAKEMKQLRSMLTQNGLVKTLNENDKLKDRITELEADSKYGMAAARLDRLSKWVEQLNETIETDIANLKVLMENNTIKRIAELEVLVKEWRTKADAELHLNAKLHTRIAELEKDR